MKCARGVLGGNARGALRLDVSPFAERSLSGDAARETASSVREFILESRDRPLLRLMSTPRGRSWRWGWTWSRGRVRRAIAWLLVRVGSSPGPNGGRVVCCGVRVGGGVVCRFGANVDALRRHVRFEDVFIETCERGVVAFGEEMRGGDEVEVVPDTSLDSRRNREMYRRFDSRSGGFARSTT